MMPKTTHERLELLHTLIIRERACAIALDMQGMLEAGREKEHVLQLLSQEISLEERSKELAKKVREENRRNAYLFKATLGWIREAMQLIGKKSVVSTYSAGAMTVPSTVNGRLLSGKI